MLIEATKMLSALIYYHHLYSPSPLLLLQKNNEKLPLSCTPKSSNIFPTWMQYNNYMLFYW